MTRESAKDFLESILDMHSIEIFEDRKGLMWEAFEVAIEALKDMDKIRHFEVDREGE